MLSQQFSEMMVAVGEQICSLDTKLQEALDKEADGAGCSGQQQLFVMAKEIDAIQQTVLEVRLIFCLQATYNYRFS